MQFKYNTYKPLRKPPFHFFRFSKLTTVSVFRLLYKLNQGKNNSKSKHRKISPGAKSIEFNVKRGKQTKTGEGWTSDQVEIVVSFGGEFSGPCNPCNLGFISKLN